MLRLKAVSYTHLAASVAASVAADVDGGVDGAEFIPVGKRACERYGDGFLSSENFSFEDARSFSSYMCEEFARGEYDRLGIIYTCLLYTSRCV